MGLEPKVSSPLHTHTQARAHARAVTKGLRDLAGMEIKAGLVGSQVGGRGEETP